MLRTQIQITNQQARQLRAWARREGISLSEAIRRCLDKVLPAEAGERAERFARAARLVGAFADAQGASDLAEKHDEYLDGAYK
jgi:hypothetical protein